MSSPRDPAAPAAPSSAALARGGRTNFLGFLLRLMARFPFLVIAARLYGAEDLGRFAYATMVVEFAGALATLGLKRGVAAEMARGDRPDVHALADALLLGLLAALAGTLLLLALPQLMFPDGTRSEAERWLALIVPAIVIAELSLAGLAFRHRIGVAVRARSIIEPWVLTLAASALAFTFLKPEGLLIAFALSLLAAATASLWPALSTFGLPQGWRPSAAGLQAMAQRNLPLAGADLVEWSTRRVDVLLLGRFAGAEAVGLYFVAQQVATLAGKIRTSFDPILAPMLSTALKAGRPEEAAAHIRQVGFWVLAFQLPVVLALGLPGEGVMGLFGPEFAAGALVMALLLTAELAAANSSISEMGLIYARPRANLVIAVSGLAFQAAISLFLVPRFGGEGAAAGLLIALVAVAIARQIVLGRALGANVGFWRWSLLAAGAVTFLFGTAARLLPELPQMILTIPGTLLLFGAIIWHWGFGPDDRALFARRR
jgi:O-antigen/teichoic acid export membrane protein